MKPWNILPFFSELSVNNLAEMPCTLLGVILQAEPLQQTTPITASYPAVPFALLSTASYLDTAFFVFPLIPCKLVIPPRYIS